MIVLSHRGYWKKNTEKNTQEAFKRSFQLGFGTETDVRDYAGKLVISHDPPLGHAMKLDVFLDLYKEYGEELPLAINIKSDGLQEELSRILESYQIKNYFVFDMSVPDGLRYIKKNLRAFTRQSEYEREPSYYENASGVWMDEFNSGWITEKILTQHISNKKPICIVSPELHGREHTERWKEFKNMKTFYSNEIMLCTDYPEQAQEFFNVAH